MLVITFIIMITVTIVKSTDNNAMGFCEVASHVAKGDQPQLTQRGDTSFEDERQ